MIDNDNIKLSIRLEFCFYNNDIVEGNAENYTDGNDTEILREMVKSLMTGMGGEMSWEKITGNRIDFVIKLNKEKVFEMINALEKFNKDKKENINIEVKDELFKDKVFNPEMPALNEEVYEHLPLYPEKKYCVVCGKKAWDNIGGLDYCSLCLAATQKLYTTNNKYLYLVAKQQKIVSKRHKMIKKLSEKIRNEKVKVDE